MYYYGRDKKRRFKKRLRISLITFAVIGFFGISYFLYSVTESPADNVPSVNLAENSFAVRKTFTNKVDGEEKNGLTRNDVAVGEKNEDFQKNLTQNSGSQDQFDAPSRNGVKSTYLKSEQKSSLKTVYEVISEAHFYNRPSEQARRSEFIPYWNMSPGAIKPIEEKNGFLYVVFKYPSGETAKGWLRKRDLHEVNTIYGDNKG